MQGGDTFSITLLDPRDQPFDEAIRGVVPQELGPSGRFMIFNVFPPLQVDEPGRYKVVIVINDDLENRQEVPLVIRSGEDRVVH